MKYWIWPLGCQMNKSDAERIEKILKSLGYKKTDDDKLADLIVVVACSVRQSAIDRVYGKFRWWAKRQKKGELIAILTGCVLDHDIQKFKPKFDLIIDLQEINKIPKFLEQTDIKFPKNYLKIDPDYISKYQAYVPISTGCNNYCTYCAVPYTRGREKSRPSKDIIAEVKNLIKKGYKEITLLGENVNSYGLDKKTEIDFPTLLEKIAKLTESGNPYSRPWIRFTSPHPKDFSDELIEVIAKYPNVCNQINLPVQSGSNAVLKKMNRPYTVAQYKNLYKKIRQEIPDVSISTDVIVGFPGETKKQFEDTAKLFKELKFNMAFTAQFSVRPGTAASQLKDNVSQLEKKRREKQLTSILMKTALDHNKKLVGTIQKILVEKYSKDHWLGRTEGMVTVRFKAPKNRRLAGRFIDIKITKAESFSLAGRI
ncbi:tRNA (N6-isopentenyl adenosine(37)-C2)-methylthiotransferase MiaB [Patescibacteria group bacterium]|nr:tRNA (N6-isopentenyl adenosine(37)-C2)-methylthiotransferase MiaB [Patescibacteria group bacterium]MBU1672886.1 tRNA (N6-isopentenyl adenosine(37)-C2)-methylthiotransferase MiaB [Patescibacteria group bacterium]MBU1963137.1 tRNA (N6-isopentenyl adenosine(37)-C2)-methylthiotransferase MiaB [Patescibacteria group bacterium]